VTARSEIAGRVRALLDALEEEPDPAVRMSKLEEAIAIADAGRLDDDAFRARLMLVEEAVFHGRPELALAAFAWCVAKCDREPDRFSDSTAVTPMGTDVLWAHKWIVQELPGYPQFSRERITRTLDEMEARYARNGKSLRPVFMQRAQVALMLRDDASEVRAHLEAYRRAPRDRYADCRACEINFEAGVLADLGEHRAALAAAEPVLDGTLGCAHVPHYTYGHALECAWALGEHAAAARCFELGYPLVRENREFLRCIARHLEYAVAAGRLDEARGIVERHLPWAAEAFVLDRRLWFYVAARNFAEVATEPIRTTLPHDVSFRQPSNRYDPKELAGALDREIESMAARFDARNGRGRVLDR
jgi:hypothetical protein